MSNKLPIRPPFSGFVFRIVGGLMVIGSIYAASVFSKETSDETRLNLQILAFAWFLSSALIWSFGDWLRNVDERLAAIQSESKQRE